MAVSVATLLTDLGLFLHDPTAAIWTETIKLAYINEAVKTIALVRPDSMATTTSLTMTANTPKQSIPADGTRLLYVARNVATGKPIRKISREVLNETAPGWEPQTVTDVDFYMFDEENPLVFYVYPVPNSALAVEIVYSQVPGVLTAQSSSLGVSDVFLAPIKDYAIYRCFGMESKGTDYQKATYYMNSFYNALGVKLQNEAALRAIQAVTTEGV